MKRSESAGMLARLAVVLGLVAGALGLAIPAASAAPATGWLRLAHLSPNTPPVDVYLYSFGDPSARIVLKHVGYGTVSGYQRVPTGEYTVAMRMPGGDIQARPVHHRQRGKRRRIHGGRHGPGVRPAAAGVQGPAEDTAR